MVRFGKVLTAVSYVLKYGNCERMSKDLRKECKDEMDLLDRRNWGKIVVKNKFKHVKYISNKSIKEKIEHIKFF